MKPPPPPDPGSNPTIDYRKQKRSNDTHQSKTDPLARLYKKAKGAEAKLAYLGHILTENRNGLVVNTRVTLATGTAERAAAIEMAEEIPGGSKRVTLGADRAYDTADFVEQMKEFRVTPHVAQNDTNRRSAIDARTTSQPGSSSVSERQNASRRLAMKSPIALYASASGRCRLPLFLLVMRIAGRSLKHWRPRPFGAANGSSPQARQSIICLGNQEVPFALRVLSFLLGTTNLFGRRMQSRWRE